MKNTCAKCGKQKSEMKQVKLDSQVYLCDPCLLEWLSERDKAISGLFSKWIKAK